MAIAKADEWQGVHYLRLWCPGCGSAHQIVTSRDEGAAPGITWEWDGSLDAPTINPSIHVTGGSQGINCHSFVRAGVWEYLSDCTHALAGQHVAIPEWDEDA